MSRRPPTHPSKQESYARNLGGTPLGLAIYSPIQFRPSIGRVGDIAFFDSDGTYRRIANAFDDTGLADWHWPRYAINEQEAVTSETPAHFRVAVGGSFDATQTQVETSANVPLPTASGISIGGSVSVTLKNNGTSTSVLIPGDDNLEHRVCLGRQESNLLFWFSTVETQAWEYVNAVYRHRRPKSIFLVTGQTLTSNFAVSHQETSSSSCEFSLQPQVNFTELIKANILLGHSVRRATAFRGFQFSPQGPQQGSLLFSVYLEIYESPPMKRMRSTLNERLVEMFKYFEKRAKIKPEESKAFKYVRWGSEESSEVGNIQERFSRVPMQSGNSCNWYLLMLEDDFFIQYTGPDPEEEFPADISDEHVMDIVERLQLSSEGIPNNPGMSLPGPQLPPPALRQGPISIVAEYLSLESQLKYAKLLHAYGYGIALRNSNVDLGVGDLCYWNPNGTATRILNIFDNKQWFKTNNWPPLEVLRGDCLDVSTKFKLRISHGGGCGISSAAFGDPPTLGIQFHRLATHLAVILPASPGIIMSLRPAYFHIIDQWWGLAKRYVFRTWPYLINSSTGVFLVTQCLKTHRYAQCMSKGTPGESSQMLIHGITTIPQNPNDIELPPTGNLLLRQNDLGFEVHDSGEKSDCTIFIKRNASRMYALTDISLKTAAQRLWNGCTPTSEVGTSPNIPMPLSKDTLSLPSAVPAIFDGKDSLILENGWSLIRGADSFFLEHATTGLDLEHQISSTQGKEPQPSPPIPTIPSIPSPIVVNYPALFSPIITQSPPPKVFEDSVAPVSVLPSYAGFNFGAPQTTAGSENSPDVKQHTPPDLPWGWN